MLVRKCENCIFGLGNWKIRKCWAQWCISLVWTSLPLMSSKIQPLVAAWPLITDFLFSSLAQALKFHTPKFLKRATLSSMNRWGVRTPIGASKMFLILSCSQQGPTCVSAKKTTQLPHGLTNTFSYTQNKQTNNEKPVDWWAELFG